MSITPENSPPNSQTLALEEWKELVTRQERIDDTQLVMYILDAKAPERARLDIFERVNSGAPLTRQQMRNALYNGRATEWLSEAANSNLFRQATGDSLQPKTMRDREAINRFCAFTLLGLETYMSSDMDGFLGKVLDRMNGMALQELQELRERFDRSMQINYELFGRHAFRKSLAENNQSANRSVINIALFDVCSVLFSRISLDLADDDQTALRQAAIERFQNNTFRHDITDSTNSRLQVRGRVNAAESAFERFLR